MVFTRWLGVLTAVGAYSFAAGAASAEPATAGSLQLGVGYRYGWELRGDSGDPNPWRTGVGVNGGVTLPLIPVYLGGHVEYFFGETNRATFATPAGRVQRELSARLWQFQGEGGYDLELGSLFVVRPKLGLGYAYTKFDGGGIVDDESTSAFVVAPGIAAILVLPVINVQAGLRYDVVFSDPTRRGLVFSAGVGF